MHFEKSPHILTWDRTIVNHSTWCIVAGDLFWGFLGIWNQDKFKKAVCFWRMILHTQQFLCRRNILENTCSSCLLGACIQQSFQLEFILPLSRELIHSAIQSHFIHTETFSTRLLPLISRELCPAFHPNHVSILNRLAGECMEEALYVPWPTTIPAFSLTSLVQHFTRSVSYFCGHFLTL